MEEKQILKITAIAVVIVALISFALANSAYSDYGYSSYSDSSSSYYDDSSSYSDDSSSDYSSSDTYYYTGDLMSTSSIDLTSGSSSNSDYDTISRDYDIYIEVDMSDDYSFDPSAITEYNFNNGYVYFEDSDYNSDSVYIISSEIKDISVDGDIVKIKISGTDDVDSAIDLSSVDITSISFTFADSGNYYYLDA